MSTDQECLHAAPVSARGAFVESLGNDPAERPGVGGHSLGAGQASYQPGELIACKYELRRLLRNGGMGSVWVARHLMLDVSIAIKLIRTDLAARHLTQHFVTEARLAARLEHPGIVSVFDLGVTERGHPFIAMELLTGEDLRELIARERRLDPVRCVQLLLPIAAALASAHGQGIVHRDLKPENVFVARTGDRLQPKIIDFGIAKPAEIIDGHITWAGSVVGSPDYMAPEQARGLELDHRVDVWAFCAVLYECVTGVPPFVGTDGSVLADIVSKPACPITERGVFDPQLSAIIQRGLEKEPAQRWQDMRELGRALAQWLLTRWVDEDVCGQSLRSTWLKHEEGAILGGAFEATGPADKWARSSERPWIMGSRRVPESGRSVHGRPRAAALVATGALLSAIGSVLTMGFRDLAVETPRLDSVGQSARRAAAANVTVVRSLSVAGQHGVRAISGCPSGRGLCEHKAPQVTPTASQTRVLPPKPSVSPRSPSVPHSPPRSSLKDYDFGF